MNGGNVNFKYESEKKKVECIGFKKKCWDMHFPAL